MVLLIKLNFSPVSLHRGAYDVGTYLDSPILIPLATHRLMLTEALLKLKKKFSVRPRRSSPPFPSPTLTYIILM